jgi:DNA-binding NtrC family response regulator
MSGFWVEILHHDGREEVRQLPLGRLLIGRDQECWLCPLDPALSRQHAALEVSAEGVLLECLPSRNQTRVNGEPRGGAVALVAGDEVLAGRTLFRLRLGDAGSSRQRRQATVDLQAVAPDRFGRPLGSAPAFVAVLERAEKVATSALPVLITGESGTGKELLARHMHELSPRRDGPFVVLNCPALAPGLVESELFGVEAGVATGVTARSGLLVEADGGTIFLDEIGDLPRDAQAKLLRFLQELAVVPVGGRKPIKVDTRILAATNRDLQPALAEGSFRPDLYYRLAGVTLHLPPLRERRTDIPLLARAFLTRIAPGSTLSEDAMVVLESYHFPGNVRELEAVIARASCLASGGEIEPGDLGLPTDAAAAPAHVADAATIAERLERQLAGGELELWSAVYAPFQRRELPRAVVKELVSRGLAATGGSIRQLAERWHTGERYRKLLDFLRNNGFLQG